MKRGGQREWTVEWKAGFESILLIKIPSAIPVEFQLGEKKNKESTSALRVATVFRKSHYDRSPHRLAEICSRRSNEEGIENIGRISSQQR